MPVSAHNSTLTEEKLRFSPEGQYLERKGRGVKPIKIAQELIGMLNSGGGVLVYGIADDGEIGDLQKNDLNLNTPPPELNHYRSLVHDFIEPPAHITREEIYLDKGELVFLYHVEPDCERVFQQTDTEQVYLRVADSNRRLSREEVKALEYNKHIRNFEDESRPDFSADDLDHTTCQNYLDKINYEGSFEELALHRALATKNEGNTIYKNCAILLFAKNPDNFITNATIRYVRYKGITQQSGKEFNVIKDQRFEGNLPTLISTLVEPFMEASLRDYYFLDSEKGRFIRIPEFPRDAWLEGIVNALCHRSYNIQGNPILIKHYDNRIEISNSGPLPAQVTVENIKETRFARNPRIARTLYDLGYVRELNEGVKRIYGAMEELSLAKPEYTDKNDTVTLTLKNSVTDHQNTIYEKTLERIEMTWKSLNSTQRKILSYLLANQQSTVTEMAEFLDLGVKTIRINYKKLEEYNIIERISNKQRDPNAKYQLKNG